MPTARSAVHEPIVRDPVIRGIIGLPVEYLQIHTDSGGSILFHCLTNSFRRDGRLSGHYFRLLS